MKILLHAVIHRLFQDHGVRTRILSDYGITSQPATAEDFATAIVAQLDQIAVSQPLAQRLTNAEVFRAAVKALGSNNRAWATFLRSEPRINELLYGYDPERTFEAFASGDLTIEQLKEHLPGQSSTNDARAIRSWASLLCSTGSFFDRLRQLGSDLQTLADKEFGCPIRESHLPLLVVGSLAGTATRRTPGLVRNHRNAILAKANKLPGMGYILASEFLRNLRFSAFKPDRHIQRLFDLWCPHANAHLESETSELLQLLGTRTTPLAKYLRYSLLGIKVTPPGVAISYVDNLVWLLGAYVEKKGHESNIQYLG